MTELYCKNCGGSLIPLADELCKCENCGSTYANISARKQQELLDSFLDKQKQEQLNSLRRHLWQETTAKFIDSEKITSICLNIKNIYPEDFLANFYEVACGDYEQALIDFIDSINVKEHHELIEPIINFLIKSLKSEYLLSVNNLIERAYKQSDLQTFNKLTTAFASQAKLVEEGVYELNLPRDVFVAYSSADMSEVQKVVTALESEGLTCFVAMRNLQHGVGAVNNYQQALETAIDNCKIFLFISSKNSRSFKCDAIKHELPYLKKSDLEQLRYKFPNVDYVKIDNKYKKPRIQLRLDDAKSMADVLVNEIFAGLEYCYSLDGVKERIAEYLYSNNTFEQTTNIDLTAIKQLEEELRKQQEIKKLEEERQEREKFFNFELKVNKKEYVVGLKEEYKKVSKIAIPSTYEGLPVTSIGKSAFEKCSALVSVKIPNSVTKIGSNAFNGCRSLTSIEIPNSVTTIGDSTFNGCSSLTSVEIPNSVTKIGSNAFNGCSSLTSVKMPNSVTTIGDSTFNGCSSLTSIEIPNSVTEIGSNAFNGCRSLTSILIPNSVTTIGGWVFSDCDNLSAIYYEPKNKPWLWVNDWNNTNATVYCYSETKPFLGMGRYWRYVNGVPTKW